MLSRQSLRSILTVFGIIATTVLLGAGCNGCNHEEVVPKPAKTSASFQTFTEKVSLEPVLWPALTVNQVALQTMPTEARSAVALSGTPVLLPNDPKILAAGIMIEPGAHGYNYGTPEPVDGLYLTMGSSRTRIELVEAPGEPPFQPKVSLPDEEDGFPVRGNKGVFISYNSETGGREAAWMDYGQTSYMVTIYCTSIADDPRCMKDDYLIDLVKNLVYVGGTK